MYRFNATLETVRDPVYHVNNGAVQIAMYFNTQQFSIHTKVIVAVYLNPVADYTNIARFSVDIPYMGVKNAALSEVSTSAYRVLFLLFL